jgi:23S rRNA (pseudouridine1915-N3)-methyltransferase
MLRITVICQGRLKEKYFVDACREYEKRLNSYCQADIIEIAEDADVLPKIPKGNFVVALCVEGVKLSSQALAEMLGRKALQGESRLCFLIGGSEGLPEAAKESADFRLSMSDMTFPHHLARVMLLEQLYRAFSINAGAKYHK